MDKVIDENDNIVFIGAKPFMNYVTSVVIQFTTKGRKDVVIKARGKLIGRAIDIVEIVRKKFLKDKNLSISEVKIDSNEVENKEGRKVNVSTIELTLSEK